MSVMIVSDLHLGHKSIVKHTNDSGTWRGGVTTVDEHDRWVIDQCLSVGANKRTYWIILGDVAMSMEKLPMIKELPGRKVLVLGNHAKFNTAVYLKYFEVIRGSFKRYGMWFSHIPLHPKELRGLCNIHGHTHHNTLADDPLYFNAAIEWLPHHRPIELEALRKIMFGKE